MTNPKDLDAALVLWRFGLGAKEGSLQQIAGDPRDLLHEEIAERAVPIPVGPQLHSTPSLLAQLRDFQDLVKAEREALKPTQVSAGAMGAPNAGPAMTGDAGKTPLSGTTAPAGAALPAASSSGTQPKQLPAADQQMQKQRPDQEAAKQAAKRPYLPQQILLAEADARFNGTIHQPLIGFGERLAMFWTNHFSVATGKGGNVHILAGAFEREAIRPHIFGRFEDLLLAVETHPAMLYFLDNQQSIGPDSNANRNGKRGLNENLAREIMELHTLGVDGGYSQADVTALARIITGWSVPRNENTPGSQGAFSFNGNAHQPGEQTLLGITYGEGGFEQGRQALSDLARHPATARHLAFKLARHFVSDNPSADLVNRLTAAYTKTKGDLSAVYLALISADEAWNPKLAKMRMPMDYVVAIIRSTGISPKPEQIISVLKALGQPLWDPAGPNGFSDTTDAWASSEGLATRIDAANLFAHQVAGSLDPRAFATDRLGPLLSGETLTAVSRAETKQQGLSIAFLSPEFQRR